MNNKIVWREGLFIRPQHFQQSDRYYQYELMTRTASLSSNSWGFFDLEIDTSLLAIGKIVVNKASGILQDGTLFDLEAKDGVLSLDITNDDTNKSVYLALPISVHNSDEVYFEDQEDQEDLVTRFSARTVTGISNSNSGENSVSDLLISRHNFSLLAEKDLSAGYVTIKIAKILSLNSSNQITLYKEFMPTFLHLDKLGDLISQLKELRNMISFRAVKLAEKISSSSLQASELGSYLMLQLLNKTESKLHFLTTQDKVHPQDLFLILTNLAAELAIFMKKDRKLDNQFTYVHSNLSESFQEVIEVLKNMLSMVIEQGATALTIEKRKYAINVIKIPDKELLKNSSFILSVTANMSTDKLKESLMSHLKMGNIENIRHLVNYHLSGYTIKSLPSPPREIPYRMNNLYFSIELNNEELVELDKSGGFAFHMAHELEDVEYSLWVIRNA
jgi:type VI secretion system protein ImpJ